MTDVVTGYLKGFSTVKATAHCICIEALLEMSTDTSFAKVQNTTRYTRPEKSRATMQDTSPFTTHFTVHDTVHDTRAETSRYACIATLLDTTLSTSLSSSVPEFVSRFSCPRDRWAASVPQLIAERSLFIACPQGRHATSVPKLIACPPH